MHRDKHMCGGQRSTLGVIPRMPSILFFQTEGLIDLGVAKDAKLVGQPERFAGYHLLSAEIASMGTNHVGLGGG